MAFGTWFKNLLTKGKAFIKKASPYIRKGIEIARKIGPMFGDAVGGVVNTIANGADYVLNKIDPNGASNTSLSKPNPKPTPIDFSNFDKQIEMISKPILGGNKGRMMPILK